MVVDRGTGNVHIQRHYGLFMQRRHIKHNTHNIYIQLDYSKNIFQVLLSTKLRPEQPLQIFSVLNNK